MTDARKRKILLYMLEKDLRDIKVDFLQNYEIFGWACFSAGRYVAAGIISGHLTKSNVMDHFIEIVMVHQKESAEDALKDIMKRNIKEGMKTPATQEMVENLISCYRQTREQLKIKEYVVEENSNDDCNINGIGFLEEQQPLCISCPDVIEGEYEVLEEIEPKSKATELGWW